MDSSREPGRAGFFPVQTLPDWGGRATRAEVSLEAIAANASALARHVAPGSLMAVVKANAYGHGATMVAATALESGASWLAVYSVEEGVVLRRSGIQAPVLVFGPFEPAEARAICLWNLTPTVTSVEAAERLQLASGGKRVTFHLKLDTGLNRAGVAPSEAAPLMRKLREYPALEPQGLYTHFHSADEAEKEPTRQQLQTFLDTAAALEREGFCFPLHHVANSAATIGLPPALMQLARAGISLYGYYPSDAVGRSVPLRPALSLLSTVTRVQRVPAGTGVGYGHEFRCSRDSLIALVPVGYGDGLPRALGHGRGTVLVRALRAPIVGRVSMDQITVDVTDAPEVSVGDDVTLIGAAGGMEQTADDLARQAGTICYDILAGLLPRVPRLYVRRGEIVAVQDLLSGVRSLVEEGQVPVPALSLPD